jgi:hypothetical protein
MGGEREFTTTTDVGETIGKIRIHENAGEVHFHDDKNKIKVAVPVATMFGVWEKLRDGRKKRFKHKDLINKSILRIEVIRKRKGPVDLQLVVEPMKDAATQEFTNFDAFIRGRGE